MVFCRPSYSCMNPATIVMVNIDTYLDNNEGAKFRKREYLPYSGKIDAGLAGNIPEPKINVAFIV